MASSSVPSAVRHHFDTAHRAGTVVSVLARFGFGAFLRQTGLDRFLPGGHHEEDGKAADHDAPLAVRVRLLLEELGPTFVKAGQIMSTRPDLVPPEFVEEFKKLQTNVPPAPWGGEEGVESVLRDEYGAGLDDAFEWIDETPIAAASIAQVHRARLRGGERVVVKILRPGIRAQMTSDLELMRLFGRLTASRFENLGFDAEAVVDEFSRQLERETDLRVEARSTQRMRRDFEEHEGVTFPRVYEDLCTRSVLVLEEIEGTLLARLDLTTLSDEQRETIIRHGADAVFRQCLVIGFFHADPHPGNIFVLENERLCFIDCGMTGLIDPGTVTQIAHIVHGAIDGDLDRVVRTAIRIGDADPRFSEDRAFRSDAWRFIDRFHGGTLGSIRMGRLLNDFFAILRKYKLRCPADIVYLIKALTTIEGVGESVAPKFDLVGYVRPYVERLVRQRFGLGAIRDRLQDAVVAYGDLIEELPGEISDLLRSVRQNRLSFNLDHRGLDRLTDEVERASMNLSWAFVVASFVVASAVLILADNLDGETSALTTIATWAFVGSIGAGAIRFVFSRFKR